MKCFICKASATKDKALFYKVGVASVKDKNEEKEYDICSGCINKAITDMVNKALQEK